MLLLALSLSALPQSPLPLLSEHRGPVGDPGSHGALAAVGDLDGDGTVDLWWQDVHWNRGDGRFERNGPSTTIGYPARASSFLELFDLEGDGDLDALVGGDLRVFVNQGDGTFLPTRIAAISGAYVNYAYAVHADFNGDGVEDFAYAYDSEDYFPSETYTEEAVYLSKSGGGWTKRSLRRGRGAMVPMDRDGDGDIDLVVFDRSNAPGKWFEHINDGGGLFLRVPDQPAGLPLLNGAVPDFPHDFNGDGRQDLVVSDTDLFSPTPTHSEVWLDDGAGGFVPAPSLPAGVDAVIGTGDFDGDGFEDLVATGYDGSLRLLVNDGFAGFGVLTSIPGVDGEQAHLADVDGDGDDDLVVATPGVVVLQQVSALEFVLDEGSLERGLPVSHCAVADVDGDGDPDAYLGDGAIHVNDGTGVFRRDGARLSGASSDPGAPAFLDHDGDGDLDLFLGAQMPQLFENDGTGFFAPVPGASLPVLPKDARVVRAADLSGDGLDDLALFLQPGSPQLVFLENLGAGQFAYRVGPFTTFPTWGFDLGDVNGDGSVDLLMEEELWANAPWPTTGPLPFAQLPVPQGFEAELLVDMDGDGDLDAATGRAIYPNLGGGAFGPATAPSKGRALAAGDMDGDSIPDLYTLSDRLGHTWERNDGTGNFTYGGSTRHWEGGLRSLTFSSLASTYYFDRAPLLFDADLDGDADLLWGAGTQALHTNLSRGFYVHGIAGPGHTLVMSVYGPPNTPWFLAFAERSRARTTNLGRLLLDLTTQVPVTRHGGLGNDGRVVIEIPILAVPSLAGLSYVGQALVGGPLRLTNADWFTFLDE